MKPAGTKKPRPCSRLDVENKRVGIVHLHDLMRSGAV